jgi:poly(3-hydroxybutyrate) depolymerase
MLTLLLLQTLCALQQQVLQWARTVTALPCEPQCARACTGARERAVRGPVRAYAAQGREWQALTHNDTRRTYKIQVSVGKPDYGVGVVGCRGV